MTRARLDGNPNVPTSARASEVTANSAQAPTPTVAERLRADAAGTAAVDAQATPAGIAAREIMTRAGLQRAASGQTTVQDSASIGRSAEVAGLNAREQIYGTQTALLNPPSAPYVEFTNNRRVGAASFAQNVGTATDNFLIRRMDSTGRPELYRDLNQLSPDQLLAAFLKINITDPNDNPATQNKLYEISTEMRQLAIVEAKKKIENAREQQKEAEAYAQQAQYISQVVQVVSIAMAVFTMGSSLAAAQAVQAGVVQPALQQVQTMTLEQVKEALTKQLAEATTDAARTQIQVQLNAVNNAMTQLGSQASQMTMQQAIQTLGATPQLAAANASTIGELAQVMQSQLANNIVATQQAIVSGQSIPANVQTELSKLSSAQIEMIKSTTLTQSQAQSLAAQQISASVAGTPAASVVNSTLGTDTLLAQARGMFNQAFGMSNPNMQMAQTAVSAGGKVVDAGAQAQLADMQLRARQTELEARRWEFVADQAQARVEDSAQVINTMMQSRNQVIDNVMQMSQNQHVTAMRIQSAGMSR